MRRDFFLLVYELFNTLGEALCVVHERHPGRAPRGTRERLVFHFSTPCQISRSIDGRYRLMLEWGWCHHVLQQRSCGIACVGAGSITARTVGTSNALFIQIISVRPAVSAMAWPSGDFFERLDFLCTTRPCLSRINII